MNMQAKLDPTSAQPFRFTVDQFLTLCDQGMFDDFAKSELIEGEIVTMAAQYTRHARAKSRLATEIAQALRAMGSSLEVLTEVSVRLDDGSLPEPDITVMSYRGDDVVPVETVALVIEVSDTTLDTDLGRKSDLYAAAGVPEYWVIDLTENRALLHMNPVEHGYDGQLDVLLGEVLHAGTIEGLSVETTGLLD
jgi:Uma2 family endonuclease